MNQDQQTADAFASSWNNVGTGSVYTRDQIIDWFYPLSPSDFSKKSILELGCGNASILLHVMNWGVREAVAVDLGASVESARSNLLRAGIGNCTVVQSDLTEYRSEPCDISYCIGVLHHLKSPKSGFDAVIENTKPGGRFHCWVYAHEGNAIIRWFVEPIRRITCKLPWWFTKYLVATPLAVPFFLYAKTLRMIGSTWLVEHSPLGNYVQWIAKREFSFFRHVAFDQLVTPQTAYIKRAQVEDWLSDARIAPSSIYIIFRNGNSWKFGGRMA